ncbi:MAG: DUF1553 domain-containing protein [Planctomycetes bacterium]|nr:DUF1553 domain-containing protein [Planctomycetota bacterium]
MDLRFDNLVRLGIAVAANWVLLALSGPGQGAAAAGPEQWSLRPVTRPAIPRTRFDRLAANPVDHFLFAGLERAGLRPSPPADRLALLRRVTFDLTGLPPTPEEVQQFLADPSPGAYEKVVDRLLASPAYGERWGRHWLDVVRYGESNGYEQNHLRGNAWPYRDYVIRSLNADKPYTAFVAEQLAGDVLAGDDPGVQAATGFLVAGVHDTVAIQTVEGTRQQRANDLDDMVSTTGAAFLGLTVGCARCHDHKFDPVPQKDYYRLAAVLAGVRHGERPLAPGRLTGKEEKEAAQRQWRRHQLSGRLGDLDAQARSAVLRSRGVNPVPRPAVGARRNVEDFAPVRARFVRFTVLATRDGTEPCLDELEVYGPGGGEDLALASRGARARASSLLPGYRIHQIQHLNDGQVGNDHSWISSERGRGWAQIEFPQGETISRVVWSRDAAGDRPRFQDRLPSDYRVEVSEDGDCWRLAATGSDRAPAPEMISEESLEQGLSPAQRGERGRLTAELASLPDPEAVAVAYIGQFTAPDSVHILPRGDVMRPGALVTPGALSGLPGLSPELNIDPRLGEAGPRLALARWLTDPRNPLTARVLVNRVWQYHFGCGIVATPSDFGRGGEPPSHPELLDWLAAEFMAQGWRLKPLHRLLVTSYSYRQAAATNPQGLAADGGNRLVWHVPLRRLEAEALRDSILAVSGRLDRRMGGPGFRLFRYRVVNVAIYEPLEEQGPETWRRSVYQQPARAARDDLLAGFDCPECAQRTPRRDVSTTPLQALSLWNSPFTVQQAGFFAERARREAGPRPRDQVDRAFRLAFGRPPSSDEQHDALELVARHGLAALCRALLNSNEFLYY